MAGANKDVVGSASKDDLAGENKDNIGGGYEDVYKVELLVLFA